MDANARAESELSVMLELIRRDAAAPKPVDWRAVARDAAVRIAAARVAVYPEDICDAALELVAEMKKHDGFGGGA